MTFRAKQVVRNQTFTFDAPTLAAALNAADSLTALHRIPAHVEDTSGAVLFDCADPHPVVIHT